MTVGTPRVKAIRSGLNSSHGQFSVVDVRSSRMRRPSHGAASSRRSRLQHRARTTAARPQKEGLHRAGSIRAQSDRRVSSEASTASKIGTTSGQVFWLPDHSTNRAFPRIQSQWRVRRSSPDTAAGPRRIQTVFPILSKQHASSTQVGRACYRPREGLQLRLLVRISPPCVERGVRLIAVESQSLTSLVL